MVKLKIVDQSFAKMVFKWERCGAFYTFLYLCEQSWKWSLFLAPKKSVKFKMFFDSSKVYLTYTTTNRMREFLTLELSKIAFPSPTRSCYAARRELFVHVRWKWQLKFYPKHALCPCARKHYSVDNEHFFHINNIFGTRAAKINITLEKVVRFLCRSIYYQYLEC